MIKFKSSLIAPSLAFLLSVNMYASEVYTIKDMSLKEAIQKISEKSKLSYFADESLIEGKISPNIKNVEGIKNALKSILEVNGLESIIEDNTIIIRKKSISSKNSSDLGNVDIVESSDNTTEGTGSYTIEAMNTATKMNLSIKETPQSVSVITNEQMKDFKIETINDVFNTGTALYTDVGDTERITFKSRGFDVENFQIDGVNTNFGSGSGEVAQDLTIYDRVEIVRGASGLLSGVGEPSATINLVRKKPNAREFQGSIKAEIGSWNKKKATIDLASALNEEGDLRFRVIASKSKEDSYRDFKKNEMDILYGIVEKDISDTTKVTFGASYQNKKTDGVIWGSLPAYYSDGSRTNWDVSKTTSSPWTYRDTKQTRAFASIDHIFDNDIKVNAAYNYGVVDGSAKLSYLYGDIDKTTGLGLSSDPWSYPKDKTTEHSVDIFASVPFEFKNLDHEFILGSSFSKRHEDRTSAGTSATAVGSFNDWQGTPEPIWEKPKQFMDEKTKQIAYYAATKLSLHEDLKMILGARVTTYSQKGPLSFGTVKPHNNEEKNVITPYFGLVYDLNETYTIYTSYTDIFKPQDEQDVQGNTLEPVLGKNYEIGAKASFNDDKINVNFAAYRIEQDNVAQEDGSKKVLNTQFDAYYSEDGVTTKGFETELSGEITDSLNLGVGYSQFKVTNKIGKEINKDNPTKKFNINGKYTFNKLSLGASLVWKNTYFSKDGANSVTQNSFFVADISAGYKFSNTLSAQVNVANLFDKHYYGTVAATDYNFSEPRKVTAELTYKF